MRSKAKTYRLPSLLEEAFSKRWAEAGYDSEGEYILGLLRYDLMSRKPHAATAELSKLGRSDQDRVDKELARLFESGETLAGSWMEAKMRDVAKELGMPKPEPHKLVGEILKRLGGK